MTPARKVIGPVCDHMIAVGNLCAECNDRRFRRSEFAVCKARIAELEAAILEIPFSVQARVAALEDAMVDLMNTVGSECANLVRLPWVDDAPQDSVDRDSVVDIAMRLKRSCDIARAVLYAAPEEKGGVK